MAYSQGDTILDDEYNTFVTGDAAGSGTHGVQVKTKRVMDKQAHYLP